MCVCCSGAGGRGVLLRFTVVFSLPFLAKLEKCLAHLLAHPQRVDVPTTRKRERKREGARKNKQRVYACRRHHARKNQWRPRAQKQRNASLTKVA